MRKMRPTAAFVSGLFLYSTAVWIGGRLASLPLPPEYVEALGGRYSSLFISTESVVIAVVMFGLALGWAFVTVRPWRPGRRPTTIACMTGIGCAWLGWVVYGAFDASAAVLPDSMPVGNWLLSSEMPPLWGVLNIMAIIAGVVFAGSLARRFAPPKPSRSMRAA
jgi:hypothetical protein